MYIVTLHLNNQVTQKKTYKKEKTALKKKHEWNTLYKGMEDDVQITIHKQ